MLRILQQVPQWLGQTSDLPVAQEDGRILRIELLTGGDRIFFLRLDARCTHIRGIFRPTSVLLADTLKALILNPSSFCRAATHYYYFFFCE